jgi:hypothetical protein
VVRSIVGRYNPEGIDPNAFASRVQERNYLGSVQTALITMLPVGRGGGWRSQPRKERKS